MHSITALHASKEESNGQVNCCTRFFINVAYDLPPTRNLDQCMAYGIKFRFHLMNQPPFYLVFFLLLKGYGDLNTTGGNGDGPSAGGGSGGRIAIYTNNNIYRGTYLAFGGDSVPRRYGGPGTVFLKDVRSKRPFTQLRYGS